MHTIIHTVTAYLRAWLTGHPRPYTGRHARPVTAPAAGSYIERPQDARERRARQVGGA